MKILYFASLREKLGSDSEIIAADISSQLATVADLKNYLLQRGDNWQLIADVSTRAAVNQALANDATEIGEGDEIAFFPPVTGG